MSINKFIGGTFFCASCGKRTRHTSGSGDRHCSHCREMFEQVNSISDNRNYWSPQELAVAEATLAEMQKHYEARKKDTQLKLVKSHVFKDLSVLKNVTVKDGVKP